MTDRQTQEPLGSSDGGQGGKRAQQQGATPPAQFSRHTGLDRPPPTPPSPPAPPTFGRRDAVPAPATTTTGSSRRRGVGGRSGRGEGAVRDRRRRRTWWCQRGGPRPPSESQRGRVLAGRLARCRSDSLNSPV